MIHLPWMSARDQTFRHSSGQVKDKERVSSNERLRQQSTGYE